MQAYHLWVHVDEVKRVINQWPITTLLKQRGSRPAAKEKYIWC